MTVTEVGLTTVNDVAAVPPNVTSDASVSVVPVIVTNVPPATGPSDGETLEMVGVLTKEYARSSVAVPPAGVVITTSTSPAAEDGVTTVTEVELNTVRFVPATPPNVTTVVSVRLVPVIVTVV